jgi:hypothetical protein
MGKLDKFNTQVDLNRLRETMVGPGGTQATGDVRPADPRKQIVVNRDGKINLRSEVDGSDRTLSTVPQETFAAAVNQDQQVVSQYLPRNAERMTTDEGVVGWVYDIRTEYNDDFQFFVYFDGANYQVTVLAPELEARWKSPHTGHIFGDGRICFGNDYDSGMPTLRDAFSKSVLWANGMSIALTTGHFPFSINQ